MPRRPASGSVTGLKGVGPAAERTLAAAGIRSLQDLLLLFPKRHQDVAEVDRPDQHHLGLLVRLRGRVDRTSRAFLPGRRSIVTVTFAVRDGTLFRVAFFNQPYLKNTYQPGVERQIEGVLERSGQHFVLKNPRVVSPTRLAEGPCRVCYPEVPGVSAERLRALIHQALRSVDLDSVAIARLPPDLASDHAPTAAALRAMHEPATAAEHEAARRQFALCEAVELFRKVEAARRRRAARTGPRVAGGADADRRIARSIPFQWTGDQARAVAAIRTHLSGPPPMGVLLHGDVGTGKTAVALAAALATVSAGFQVAFLAPTELLAEQHCAVVRRWLAGGDVPVDYLSRSLPARALREARQRLRDGRAGIVFGTHSLLSESTAFGNLGLCVIDEQHRFGVGQRMRLVQKGRSPHVLVMSATPIPRTLALTLFGDLDVVTLRQRPAESRPARAVFVARPGWPRILRAIGRCVRRGGRVFVVCPKIGGDGARGGAVCVQRELGRRFRCGLLHGRLPATERQAVTAAFRAGEIDVLCGTTVLEVGVDVPDARLMVVVGAERFGLATLHQLRGRVGRSAARGLCILTGEPTERTAALCRTADGFELAEQDLRLRGAGELLGSRQSGSLDFRALEPLGDFELLLRARAAVRREAHDDVPQTDRTDGTFA